MDGPFNVRTILQTCDNWDTDYNSYNWEHKFMRIFVIPDNQEWQWTAFPFLAMFFINIFITVPSCSKLILLAEGLFLFSVDIFSWFQTSNQQFQESSFASPPAFKSPVFKSQMSMSLSLSGLKGHPLYVKSKSTVSEWVSESVSDWACDKVTFWAVLDS